MKRLQGQYLLLVVATIGASMARLIKPAPAITQPPHITPPPNLNLGPRALGLRQVTDDDPQTRDDFQGWYQTDINQAIFCDEGQTWTSSGNYARCCTSGSSCAAELSCTSSTLIVGAEGTGTCPEGYPCGTVTIYDEWPRSGPKLNFLCANDGWSAWTMYRQISTTEITSSPSSESSSSSVSESSTTASPSGTGAPPSPKSSNSGWIAGAVIGPLAIIALIAGIVFWLIRRRDKADRAGAAAPGANNYVMHEDNVDYMPHAPPGQYDPNMGYQGQTYMAEADSRPLGPKDLARELPTSPTVPRK